MVMVVSCFRAAALDLASYGVGVDRSSAAVDLPASGPLPGVG
jgi:hypothetical protein